MFKLNKVLLAVTATLFASQVFAAPVTQANIATARSAGTLKEAWISGASAPTYNIFLGYAAGCDANSLSVFNNSGTVTLTPPGSAGNFLAYACTRGGVTSVVYHTVDGGSLNAYSPHIPNNIGRPDVGTTNLRRIGALGANSACLAQTGTISIANQTAVPSFRACALVTPATLTTADNAPVLPAGGFSDVEAALFGLTTQGYGAEADANVGQVFGVATSVNLYRALQAAQGISITDDAGFLPKNAPNITRTQYASIASGAGKASVLIPGSTAKLNLARRAPTSGTQGSSNAHFLRNPCNAAPETGGVLQPIGISDSDGTSIVVTEGSGTSNAITALSTSEFAIGILSLENNWRPATEGGAAAGYRYIKLDGVHPEAPIPGATGADANFDSKARYSSAQGSYDYQIELKSFVADSAAGTFGETVIGNIVSAFAGLDCSAVPRGLTLTTFSGSSCTYGEVVSKATRFGNNCQPQQIFPGN